MRTRVKPRQCECEPPLPPGRPCVHLTKPTYITGILECFDQSRVIVQMCVLLGVYQLAPPLIKALHKDKETQNIAGRAHFIIVIRRSVKQLHVFICQYSVSPFLNSSLKKQHMSFSFSLSSSSPRPSAKEQIANCCLP